MVLTVYGLRPLHNPEIHWLIYGWNAFTVFFFSINGSLFIIYNGTSTWYIDIDVDAVWMPGKSLNRREFNVVPKGFAKNVLCIYHYFGFCLDRPKPVCHLLSMQAHNRQFIASWYNRQLRWIKMNAHSLRVRMPQLHSTQFTMPHSIQREPFHRNNYALRETTHLKTAFHSHRSVNHTIFMSACERLNETRHCLNLPTSVWLFSLVWRENIQAHFLLYEYFQLIAHLINYLLCHETKNMFASERGKIETVDAVLHALDVELNSSIIRTSNPINRCFFFRLIFFFQYRCRLCLTNKVIPIGR